MRYVIIALLLLAFCQKNYAQESLPKPIFETDTISLGDINRDSVIDYAYLTHPKWISTEEFYGDCSHEKCYSTLAFSYNGQTMIYANAVHAWIKNIGDIDEDGLDEIVVAEGWFIGCRGLRYFYTLKKGKWQLLGETYYYNCYDEADPFDPEVKKTKRGTFETPHLEFSEEESDEVTVMKTFTIK